MFAILGSVHQVTWKVEGENINVSVSDACCDELHRVLNEETERALR